MKRIATALIVVGVLLAGCSPGRPEPTLLSDPTVDFLGVADPAWDSAAMAEASVRLGVGLLGATDGDVVVSPLGLQLALASLREGAPESVAADIDAVAGLADLGSQAMADLHALLAGFDGDVAGVGPGSPPGPSRLHVADGVLVPPGSPVEQDFLRAVVAYHRGQVLERDAAGDGPRLNAWVDRETGGLLEAPALPGAAAEVALVDAVVFAGTWDFPFPAELTQEGAFTLADGTTVEVPMMRKLVHGQRANGDGWRAIELPYSDGFAMQIVQTDGRAVTAGEWRAAGEALTAAYPVFISFSMPCWETRTSVDLTDELDRLGLGTLLVPGGLDGVYPGARVGAVAQVAAIAAGEQGTVRAPASDGGGASSAVLEMGFAITLDHPFEFRVIQRGTGLVVLAGRVADPS